MSIPRPSSFARSSLTDPYNPRNNRNSSPPLNRGAAWGIGSRNTGPAFAPLSYSPPPYDPYRYNYPAPVAFRGPGSIYPPGPYGLRPYNNAGVGLVPSTLTPLGFGNQILPYRPPLLANSPRPGICDNALCSHSEGKDGTGVNMWRPAQLDCTLNNNSCYSAGKVYPHATKDILVRDSAKLIRASYLHENPKFEADLSKYLDKKDKDTVPDHVVDLLLNFINSDRYDNYDVVDEVTLCILATNVGAKSVVDKTLANLKAIKSGTDITLYELCKITPMILMSSKVDKGLTAWLKKILEKDDRRIANEMWSMREFQIIVEDRPELEVELLRLVGLQSEPKDNGFRSL